VRHNFARRGQALKPEFGFIVVVGAAFLKQDALAQLHAVIADEDSIRTRDEAVDLIVVAAAE
jgi:hypothetical protein